MRCTMLWIRRRATESRNLASSLFLSSSGSCASRPARDISVASLATAVRSDREIVRFRSDICLLSPDMTERLLAGGGDHRRAVIRVLDAPSRPRSDLAANATESIGHSPDFPRILEIGRAHV